MEDQDFLSGSWEDFETWIKAKVGGEISWKIRPRDTRVNRRWWPRASSRPLERNRGRFPPSGNLFLELERNEEDP
jgi:hypothetical protein